MHIVVTSNPAARFGRSRGVGRLAAERIRALGHEVQHVEATGPIAQLEQTRFAMRQADALVVVGGDGTVQMAANVVGGSSKPVVIVPAGSGNDFARTLGVRSVLQAIDRLDVALASEATRVDLVRIEHSGGAVLAVGIVSVGFDSDVAVLSTEMRRVPAAFRYKAALALGVLGPRHREFHLRLDGNPERTVRTLIAAIANTPTLGGGIPLVPSARIDDGRLTALLADTLSHPRFLLLAAKAFRGGHVDDPRITVEECAVAEIDGDGSATVTADGEVVGTLPIRCSVVAGGLAVLRAPADAWKLPARWCRGARGSRASGR